MGERKASGLGLRNGDKPGLRRGLMQGFSMAETCMVLGIVGALSLVGLSLVDLGGQDLTLAQEELQGSLHEAFHLARARGTDVIVALGDPKTPGIVPVRLSPRVKWGKPTGIPTPPGMDEPVVAGKTGEAHARITVTPRHTATASAWFLNDGQEAVCMRVSGHGHVQVLRWRRSSRKWSLV